MKSNTLTVKILISAFVAFFAISFAQVNDEAPENGVKRKKQSEKNEKEKTLDDFLSNLKNNPKSAKILKDAIENGSDETKIVALATLVKFAQKESYSTFLRYLRYGMQDRVVNKNESFDATWQIRALSAIGLAKLKNRNAANFLKKNLRKEPNDVVKKNMIYALGEVGDKSCISTLAREIEKTRNETMILACVVALGKIGDTSSSHILMDISKGKHTPKVKRAAIEALRKIEKK